MSREGRIFRSLAADDTLRHDIIWCFGAVNEAGYSPSLRYGVAGILDVGQKSRALARIFIQISCRVRQLFTDGSEFSGMDHSNKTYPTKFSAKNLAIGFALAVTGVALAVAGIYVGDTDDAPGAALLGILLMIVALAFAVRMALRRPHLNEREG